MSVPFYRSLKLSIFGSTNSRKPFNLFSHKHQNSYTSQKFFKEVTFFYLFITFLYLLDCQYTTFIQQQANTLREDKIRESWRIENSAAVSPWIIYLGVPSLHAWHGNKRGCRPSSQPCLTAYDRLSGKLQIHYCLTGKTQETSMMPLSGRALHLLKGWIIPTRALWWNALLGVLYVLFSIFTSSCFKWLYKDMKHVSVPWGTHLLRSPFRALQAVLSFIYSSSLSWLWWVSSFGTFFLWSGQAWSTHEFTSCSSTSWLTLHCINWILPSRYGSPVICWQTLLFHRITWVFFWKRYFVSANIIYMSNGLPGQKSKVFQSCKVIQSNFLFLALKLEE